MCGIRPTDTEKKHQRTAPVGPSLSSSAHLTKVSAPCFGVLPPTPWLLRFVDVNPGVTALTLTPSFFNSFASAIVYEFAAALDVLYATRCRMGRPAWRWFEAMSVVTLRMAACGDLRMRGTKVVQTWMRPKRLVSTVLRTVATSTVRAFWSEENSPMPDEQPKGWTGC